MKIPLPAKVSSVTIVADPTQPKGRATIVVLEIPDGAVQFRCTITEGAQWLAMLGRRVELHAAFVLHAAPGARGAPLDPFKSGTE
jgi:hypothetical protein